MITANAKLTTTHLASRIHQRFWEKVHIDPSSCWEWLGGTNGDGYGAFKLDGKVVGAHRLSFEMANGPIPDGLLVCHTCDNPGCVRPDHLFLGTNDVNVADRVSKGRSRRGLTEGAGFKITAEDVREIRRRAAGGEGPSSISRDYPVSEPMVSMIITGRKWKNVAQTPSG